MATMKDALRVLVDDTASRNARGLVAGTLSGHVADKLWPGVKFSKPHHGGPDGGQRAAAGLLGRMARRGLVEQRYRQDDPRTYYAATDAGREFMRSNVGAERRP